MSKSQAKGSDLNTLIQILPMAKFSLYVKKLDTFIGAKVWKTSYELAYGLLYKLERILS
jgi:hypothetical protein